MTPGMKDAMAGDAGREGGDTAAGGMPIVFVNHCHPDVPHVCAVRLRQFAEVLAGRGHRVVLLVAGSQNLGASPPPDRVAIELEGHDWSRPYVLACAPRDMSLLARAREGRGPAVLGRALLAAHFVANGGVFADWTAGSRPYWPVLAEKFRPEVVWATFGNTDAWRIARGIARQSGCPWVMDIKDNWESFIPSAFRGILARRFGDAAAVTALSRANAGDSARWFRRPAEVIYSGISAGFLKDVPLPPDHGAIRLALVGSLYAGEHVDALMAGIASWLRGRGGDGEPVTLAYLGPQTEAFRTAARALDGLCRVETPGMLPIDAMWDVIRRARANLFVRSTTGFFHHKIIEMLAADRPIVCLPEECDEAKGIVREVGGILHSCRTADEVVAAMRQIEASPGGPSGVSRQVLERYSWDAQAQVLEQVLRRVAEGGRP